MQRIFLDDRMIVFYQDKNNVANGVSLELEKKESICTTTCSSSCIKPKSKCCNKYQKKASTASDAL
ncbi:hypothetical protein [Tenacibaculum sp. SG-28]|uniref:hypothetical protein n=1 Tax=Tenacibaculum sp. SG-28 TaxID=754426 RepID=UPI000CF382C5|nr:hypothetical protein [Tenacibaculum sp. SG-28]PQJ21715.1 hypothetical protein BSU00_06440 [Tenacibaculum sp. SG-28]